MADIKAKYVLRDLFAKHIAAALAARPEQPAADTRVVRLADLERWESIWRASAQALDEEDYATGEDYEAIGEMQKIIGEPGK